MSISLKNHEDRIVALENRNYTRMEIIYSTTPGDSAPFSGTFSKTLDNFDLIYFDTLITPGCWPRLGTSGYIFNRISLTSYNNVTFGNDDDAVSRYRITNTGFSHTESDTHYYFRVYRVMGLKLYYNFRELFKEVASWLSL